MSSILLIEDDTFEAQTLERHLGRAGHSVTVVHTAEEALALLGREIFDVTIVDPRCPGCRASTSSARPAPSTRSR
jgi:DNA-binding response OmpR family regulator